MTQQKTVGVKTKPKTSVFLAKANHKLNRGHILQATYPY